MNKSIEAGFRVAAELYGEQGVDVREAMGVLDGVSLSIHAWQGDDLVGFENIEHALTGGCQVTGNYPGRARTAEELRNDLDCALRLIPGAHRVGLQAHQVDRMLPGKDRDEFALENFSDWLAWAQTKKIGLDIAPAFYSHPKLDNGYSLAHPDSAIRQFWIRHGKAVRTIGAAFGEVLGTPAICNFWAPDGSKDIVADRFHPRLRLRDSLDEIFSEEKPTAHVRDAVESKLFGIGTESYTVGSNEFCIAYAVTRNKMVCFDSGHFHPTETISDKLSSIFCVMDEMLLHVSRGIHWDSDHVLILNDDLLAIAAECARYDYLSKIHIGLDYFDASINRVAAWVIGARNMQKALLIALLEPRRKLLEAEGAWRLAHRMAIQEAAKTLPWGLIWDHYCQTKNLPLDGEVMGSIDVYERTVLDKRG